MKWDEASKGLENIGNYFSLELARVLFDAAQATPNDAVMLEIGAFHGFSTCALGYACAETRRHIWTIDTFCGRISNTNIQDGEDYFDIFKESVVRRGLDAYITPLVGRSEMFYETWDRPLDLLFIDGDHTIMRQDFDAFFPHLKQGGMLLMHDVLPDDAFWKSVSRSLVGAEWCQRLGWGRKP